MSATFRDIALAIAANGALVRVGAVIVGAVRSLARRRDFKTVRLGPIELVTLLEPVALAITAFALLGEREDRDGGSTVAGVCAVAGAVLVLAGLGLIAWSLWSWRGLFVGHAVAADQELVTRGAYGLVRHPVYLAAILVWAGLSLAFLNPAAALITLVYVTPAYLLYARSEEAMMVESFGDAYVRYRERVPAVLPGLRWSRGRSR